MQLVGCACPALPVCDSACVGAGCGRSVGFAAPIGRRNLVGEADRRLPASTIRGPGESRPLDPGLGLAREQLVQSLELTREQIV